MVLIIITISTQIYLTQNDLQRIKKVKSHRYTDKLMKYSEQKYPLQKE